MRDVLLVAGATATFYAAFWGAVTADESRALVPTAAVDGDTFKVGQAVYRLWGVDAPELRQPFGPEARAALDRLVVGRELVCENRGRSYQRVVVRCRLSGRDVGSAMVVDGWAWDEPVFSRSHYRMEEAVAACERRGLWQQNVLPPWAFRECSRR